MAQAIGKGGHRLGLNNVWGPTLDNPSEHQASKSKADLELMCLAEASQRFTQVSHTPFLSPPLVQIFTEFNVYTPAFEQVLQGTFESPDGTDPMTTRLIKALA